MIQPATASGSHFDHARLCGDALDAGHEKPIFLEFIRRVAAGDTLDEISPDDLTEPQLQLNCSTNRLTLFSV